MGFSAGLFLPTTWLSDLGALSYVGIMGMLSAFGLTGGAWKVLSASGLTGGAWKVLSAFGLTGQG